MLFSLAILGDPVTVFENQIIIYTDGACSGNPGPGGWAAIVGNLPEGRVIELGEAHALTTNNRMEIAAALNALKAIEADPSARASQIFLYTDSVYLIRGITQWVWGWKKRGWKNAEGVDVANQDLWQELLNVTGRWPQQAISWRYVRGHKGIPGNERCDELAVLFSKGASPELYEGTVSGYRFNISEPPSDEPLPEMKSQKKSAKPISYLSLIGSMPMRHATWSECERRVKGQSGAKFKKAFSTDEEAEILATWGYSPSDLSKLS